MADDINKKITLDVQVKSNAQEQITALDGLQTAARGIGKALATVGKELNSAKTQVASPPNENPFKNFFSNILSYYKKNQKIISEAEKNATTATNANKLNAAKTTDDQVVASARAAQTKMRSSA